MVGIQDMRLCLFTYLLCHLTAHISCSLLFIFLIYYPATQLEPAHDSRSATHDPHEKQRIVSFGTTTTFPTPSREVEQPGLPEEEDDDTPADFFDLLMAKAFQDEDTNGGTAKGDVKMNGSSCNNGRADNGPAPTAAADVIKEQQHTHLQTTTDQPKSSQQQQQQQMQDMQERLRQVSQQQLEQFRLQRVRQQQEQLLRQQQQQQQLQNQPSVLSMQADLQVLRAMHANGTVSCNTSSSSQQEPNLIPPCMPVDRSNASRTLGGRKGKPSTKQAMLSPTSNTLSNKINKKKNDHNQNQAATANHKSSNFHYVKVIGGGIVKRRPTEAATSSKSFPTTASVKRRRVVSLSNLTPHSSLQTHLDGLLTSRGYAPQKRPSRQLGYRSPPTALQLASFGSVVCASIKSSDGAADRLRSLLKSGLSPNPTNKFGDSPFFNACKRGLYPLVKEFIDAGAEVRVADGLGRTPFHYVAWANPPCLQSAKAILEANGSEGARLLYVVDAHSKTPLDFVGDEWREKWIEFLESVKDAYWPVCNDNVSSNNDDDGDSSGSDAGIAYIPEAKDDGSAVIPDPPGALSPELAAGVASGRVLPEDARRLQQEQEASSVQQEQEPDCRDNPTGSV